MLSCLYQTSFVFRVRTFAGSINVAIAKQEPSSIRDNYRRAMLVNSHGNCIGPARHDQVQPLIDTADANIAGQQLSSLVFLGSRVTRQPEMHFHAPNKSYLAEETVPDMFLDATGEFEGTFMRSVIQEPSCAWYQTAQQAEGDSIHALSSIDDAAEP